MNPVTTNPTPIEILLVEDSEADVFLTREAFAEEGILNRLHVVHDGVEAMSFLRRQAEYTGVPRPDVILLDINMPRKNGLEVLAELKADAELSSIPVIVMTTSEAEQDVLRSYQNHASSYVVKPVEFERFYGAIHALGTYMLTIVRLPPRS
ncbi:response regulator [Deinococcus sp.]|uniref:response regulator n=1 Tax=Deinococcus sp. TaxID=47478 RepID=UPI003CC6276F